MKSDKKRIDKAFTDWEGEQLDPSLRKLPERSEDFRTSSGTPIERVYLPEKDIEGYLNDIGFPGDYPFTRGVQPNMYRGRLWTMRQYAGYATASETNQRFRYLLDQGQTGLSIAFDLPTQIGYDPDDPIALGEVGKVGVSISSLEDMMVLFEGIPLDKVSTSMTINAPASILLAMYITVGKRQGIAMDQLRGTIQNDILKEYIARGTYIFPPEPAMRLVTDTFSFCKHHVPRWNTISVSGYHIREAGSTAVQEIAFTFANAIAYIEAAMSSNLMVDEVAPRMAFFFNAHNELLEEIAKFRAARRLWASIMKDDFNAKDPRSWLMRFHTQTAGSTLTAQQPENNVTRVAYQALAAILGGTQSLHTNSMDEALSLPTEIAATLALRTQQILAYESGIANTVDPLAGSYAVERLTDEVESQVRVYLDHIAGMGGALQAIKSGYFQREIQDAAYRTQLQIENGERHVVGVNQYRSDNEIRPMPLKVNPEIEEACRERLLRLRKRRDNAKVKESLQSIAHAANTSENLLPFFIEAVEADATLGEICDTLRSIWGEYQPPHLI